MFNGPKVEMKISEAMRNKLLTTIPQLMIMRCRLLERRKDQNNKEYYIVKNSWGTGNDHQGYLYVTKNHILLKTNSLFLNKEAVPNDILKG